MGKSTATRRYWLLLVTGGYCLFLAAGCWLEDDSGQAPSNPDSGSSKVDSEEAPLLPEPSPDPTDSDSSEVAPEETPLNGNQQPDSGENNNPEENSNPEENGN